MAYRKQSVSVPFSDLRKDLLHPPEGCDVGESILRALMKDCSDYSPECSVSAEGKYVRVEWQVGPSDLPIEEEIKARMLAAVSSRPVSCTQPAVTEIDVDESLMPSQVEAPPAGWIEDPDKCILESNARYYAWPVCHWFAVSDGTLALTAAGIRFEPWWRGAIDSNVSATGGHWIPMERILSARRSVFIRIPCLSIDAGGKVYRYGWTNSRSNVKFKEFKLNYWLEELRRFVPVLAEER